MIRKVPDQARCCAWVPNFGHPSTATPCCVPPGRRMSRWSDATTWSRLLAGIEPAPHQRWGSSLSTISMSRCRAYEARDFVGGRHVAGTLPGEWVVDPHGVEVQDANVNRRGMGMGMGMVHRDAHHTSDGD